ncbi:hypothetical protein J6590_081691 [Homalodisca vitripennis]|nr:hypothetical protein J6590_081691 [Homalodisca vitripennis]
MNHHAQTTVIKLPSQGDASPKFRSSRLFTDENTLLFKHFLAHEKWDEVYSADSLETKMEKFMSIISFHIDQAFPEKKVTCKRRFYSKISLSEKQREVLLKLV